MATYRRYWSLEGEAGRRSSSRRSQVGAFGAVRDMGRLSYYGIGPDSVLGNRAAYRLRETTFGTRGWFRPVNSVRLGGSVAAYMPDLGTADRRSVPSIESVFTDGSIPAFGNEPTFGRYRGFAEFVHPVLEEAEMLEHPSRYRGAYQVAFEAIRDYRTGRYNFIAGKRKCSSVFPASSPVSD